MRNETLTNHSSFRAQQ